VWVAPEELVPTILPLGSRQSDRRWIPPGKPLQQPDTLQPAAAAAAHQQRLAAPEGQAAAETAALERHWREPTESQTQGAAAVAQVIQAEEESAATAAQAW